MRAIDVLARHGEERTAKIHKALRELTEAVGLSPGDWVDFEATFKVDASGGVTMHSVSLTHTIPRYFCLSDLEDE